MEPIIQVEHLSKRYSRNANAHLSYGLWDLLRELRGRSKERTLRKDEFLAVNDVSFEMNAGESLGLVGRNGSGKTTILKMLNGLIKPDGGAITIRGRVQALINLGAGFSPNLPGRDNVYNSASLMGLSHRETTALLDEIIDFAELGDFIDSPVGTYSSGMKARLGFAVAVSLKPDILLIDEVLSVGDYAFQNKCFTRMEQLKKDGVTIIFVSHAHSSVVKLCQRAIWIHDGRVMEAGPALDTVQCYLDFLEQLEKEKVVKGNGKGSTKPAPEPPAAPEATAAPGVGERDPAVKVAISEPVVKESEIVLDATQDEFVLRGWYAAPAEKAVEFLVNGTPAGVEMVPRPDARAAHPEFPVLKGFKVVIGRGELDTNNTVELRVGEAVYWSKNIIVEDREEEPVQKARDSIYGPIYPEQDQVDCIECHLVVDGQDVDVVPIHSELTVRFSFRLKREVHGLCSTLNFHQKSGLRVAAIATLTDGRLEHIHHGHVHCDVHIPDFDFVPGHYVIVMPISEGQGYLWRDVVKEFYVDGGGRMYWGFKEIGHTYELRVE